MQVLLNITAMVFRLEWLTTMWDIKGEGAGVEILTFHYGGQRRSLLGLIYEKLDFLPKKTNRVWISVLFLNIILQW